jgi:hypothetical protein
MSVAHFAHGVVDLWPPHSETGPLHCVACGACNGEGECWPMPIASRSDRHSPGLRPASWQIPLRRGPPCAAARRQIGPTATNFIAECVLLEQ